MRACVHLVPGGEGSKGGAERHPSLASLPEGLLHQLGLCGRVHPPERALARLLLRARHLDEVAVERQVMPNGVLEHTGNGKEVILDF